MLACEVWDVAPSSWKYPIESASSSHLIYKDVEDFHICVYMMVASKKLGPIMCCQDIPHQTPIFSE